jgi:hypothetical protein
LGVGNLVELGPRLDRLVLGPQFGKAPAQEGFAFFNKMCAILERGGKIGFCLPSWPWGLAPWSPFAVEAAHCSTPSL